MELFKNLTDACSEGINGYSKEYLNSVNEIFPVIQLLRSSRPSFFV